MKNYFDESVRMYKLCFDGYDFVNRVTAFEHSASEIKYSENHCIMNSFEKLNEFYDYVVEQRKKNKIDYFGLTEYQLDKYEVGFYKTERGLNFDSKYIVFSEKDLDIWNNIMPVFDLEFMVCFSRNKNDDINGIGLRILNQEKVRHAFKWLFPLGQHCTFGLNKVDKNKPLILVEGFTDMIAGQESGYSNCVGLGSVEITDRHKEELEGFEYDFCTDQDTFGLLVRDNFKFNKSFIPAEYKDPYEAYLKTGRVDFI